MPKIEIKPAKIEDFSGFPVVRSEDLSLYRVIPEGVYIAQILDWGYVEFKSSKTGRFFAKVNPRFLVVNCEDGNAIINGTDFLMYELIDGVPTPPNGKPMWIGAMRLFIAAGLAKVEDGIFSMEGDTDTDKGMYVSIVVKQESYVHAKSGENRIKNVVSYVTPLSAEQVAAYNETIEDPKLRLTFNGVSWVDGTKEDASLI